MTASSEVKTSGGKATGAGLRGQTAGQTTIATVGKEGHGLTYRGYEIQQLAENAQFEEVAYLLLYGKAPNTSELAAYKGNRITSYNVCYTKLLRIWRAAVAAPFEWPETTNTSGFSAFTLVRVAEMSLKSRGILSSVITSYSIHYTKLYE